MLKPRYVQTTFNRMSARGHRWAGSCQHFAPQSLYSINQNRYFSTPESSQSSEEDQKQTLEELQAMINMEELKEFNPKLFSQISNDPSQLLKLQDMIIDHEHHAEAAAAAEAVTAMTEQMNQPKAAKIYTLPWIWAWGAPVFNATAAALIATQSSTGIPWMPFIVMCGFGVRACLAPMMIRQMVLINKMSHASPSFRLAAKLFKHSKLPIHKRVFYTAQALVDYARQTKTSLLSFYFYNIIQIPVFIIMVLSIRKVSYETEDLTGAGCLWFPNLNEPDPYLLLPFIATGLNYLNLGRGITKENEHWFVNRFRSFFQTLQFFHLPFTYQWPAGAFVYWISSSLFVALQVTLTRQQWFLNKVNPHFFYDYQKMYSERSPADHENYVDRTLHAEDDSLKQFASGKHVEQELENELKNFLSYKRTKKLKDKAEQVSAMRKSQ